MRTYRVYGEEGEKSFILNVGPLQLIWDWGRWLVRKNRATWFTEPCGNLKFLLETGKDLASTLRGFFNERI